MNIWPFRRREAHVCPSSPEIEIRVRLAGVAGAGGVILQASCTHLAFLHSYGYQGERGEWHELVPTMNGNDTQGMVIAPGTELVYEFRRRS